MELKKEKEFNISWRRSGLAAEVFYILKGKMPRYELSLITKLLSKEGFADVLRRTATLIMDNGGVVCSIENLGEQELPYKMKAHTQKYTHARYFLMDFFLSPDKIPEFKNELRVDTDLIRPRIIKKEAVYNEEKYKFNYLTCDKSFRKPVYKLR